MKISIESCYIKQYTEAIQNKIIEVIKTEVEKLKVDMDKALVDIFDCSQGVLYGDIYCAFDWVDGVYVNVENILSDIVKYEILEIEV